MKYSSLVRAAGVAAAFSENEKITLHERSLPNAPDGYVPTEVECPSNRPTVRSAARLSSHETDWLGQRRKKTFDAMKEFFGHVKISDFDAVSYLQKAAHDMDNVPNVGIAVSGGGYRALMNGAGGLKAFDSRTENSTASGQLGGLLQSATYLSGLSGGGWLLGSLYMNNFTSVSSLQTDTVGTPWQFSNSILVGPDDGGPLLSSALEYMEATRDAVKAKKEAGFSTTVTDYWGRALAYQLIHASEGGINFTWSSIAKSHNFQEADMPLPILVADGRNPGELHVGGNATVYEFNPWEFGTFDPTLFGFVPLEYLGSRFIGGKLPSKEKCVRGFDNAGFVMGTSSSLFNQFLLNINDTDIPDAAKDILAGVLELVDDQEKDIANYTNPFYLNPGSKSHYAESEFLAVVDGGEDLQNLPLHPLIQPERHVDVIFAIDSSADNNNWPDGTSLVATYERSLNSKINNDTAFPAIPDQNTFVNLGLNTHPTSFGCNSSNITGTGDAPLIVYIPNSPYTTHFNVSTFDRKYNNTQRDAIIMNEYHVATMGNSTRDSDWSTCVGCAMLSRSFERTNTSVPSICGQCFDRYCWNGKTDSRKPDSYEPKMVLTEQSLTNSAAGLTSPLQWASLVLGATFLALFY
ncbi:lysophospholipase Plb1 [Aspergillus steynii IBT 23096]|uniref:Lysophospholipase n=1 Tax=Aspergillus steynii IBT 23096 TaxID=1392250 RepID=A0A2I2G015_9EURO|nr:lysophospholipase Plb1 [Aspergillus steynii IBT 23096]PLB46227.1 lysophospholipase Plb1 [Aspergillus steynii IBT 23096]